MDFKELIEQSMEDGNLNTEKLNELMSDSFITKDEAQKQVNGASKRIKAKYETKLSEANSPKEKTEVKNEQTQAIDVEKSVNDAMTNFFTKQEQEKQIAKQLEVIKPEFREYVKFEMGKDEEFNMDAYLKGNPQFKDSVTTRGEQTNANGASSAPVSKQDQEILDILNKM